MRVIKKRTLEDYWRVHQDAEKPPQAWRQLTESAAWKSLAEARQTFPTADVVGRLTVFNIKGNSYRLVVRIEYEFHLVFIRWWTHAEYDKKAWRQDEWV